MIYALPRNDAGQDMGRTKRRTIGSVAKRRESECESELGPTLGNAHAPAAAPPTAFWTRSSLNYPADSELQHDLGHRPDVSLRKLDPLLPAKHRQQDRDPLMWSHTLEDRGAAVERTVGYLNLVAAR